MKIAQKISLSFLATAIILTAICAHIFFKIAQNSLKTEITAHLETTARSREEHIETYLEMLKISVAQLSKSVVLENLLRTGKDDPGWGKAFEEAMVRLRRTKEANPAIYEFLLMDAAGKVIASSNAESISQDKSADPIFSEGRKRISFKDVYHSDFLKMPLIAVSAPVEDRDTGKTIGVLAVRVALDDLNRITTDRTGLGRTGEIYLVNKDGYMITPSRRLQNTFLKQKVDTENFRLCMRRGAESEKSLKTIVCPDYTGAMVLGTNAHIIEMQWALLAEIDTNEAFAPLRKLWIIFLAIIILAPMIAWLLGMIIASFIIRPLNRLQEEMEVVGAGNLDYKVGTPARDEVGQLSRAFDTMTEELKKKIVSIDTLNKEIAERKSVEREVRRLTGRNELILESAGEGILGLDQEGKHTFVNQAAATALGYEPGELTGCPSHSLWHHSKSDGTEYPSEECPILMALKKGKTVHVTDEVLWRKDGTSFFVDYTASPVREGGKVVGTVVVFRDVSERKRSQERINKLNRMQDALLDPGTLEEKLKQITDGVVKIFDADFCRIWLIAPGDRCGSGCVHAKVTDGPHVCRYRDRCLHLVSSSGRYKHIDGGIHARVPFGCYKIGGIASGEYPGFLTNDVAGDPRVHDHKWARELGLVSFAGFQLRPPQGETMGVLALFSRHALSSEEFALLENISDVAIRVIQFADKEMDLRASEEKHKTLFESSRDALMIASPQRGFLDANSATIELFGCKDKKQFTSMGPADLSPEFQPDGKPSSVKAQEMMAMAMKEGSHFFEWTHRHMDGTNFPATVLLTRMGLKGEDLLQATVRDISEQKKLQEELTLSEKMAALGRFSVGAAHEIKNPLGIILGGMEFLQAKLRGADKDSKATIGVVSDAVMRVDAIINTLTSLAGPSEHRVRKIDVKTLINDTVRLLEPKLKGRQLAFSIASSEKGLSVEADADQIQHALLSVLMNAADAMPTGGEVTIAARKELPAKPSQGTPRCAIEVTDTGEGISKENLPKIFEPFFTTRRDRKQIGLGLTVSKEFLKSNKGDIFIASEKGKGTIVRIVLPLA